MIKWAIEIASIPLIFAGSLIIYLGRLATAATGPSRVALRDSDGPYNVCLNALLLASLAWSGWQYGELIAGALATLAWVPSWGAFAVGIGLSTFTQLIQARALRENTPSKTYDRFAANRRERLQEGVLDGLVDVAQAHGKRFNSAGMARLRMFGAFAICSWAAEFIIQALNAGWVAPWFSLGNLAVLACVIVGVFMFELMAMLDQEGNEDNG